MVSGFTEARQWGEGLGFDVETSKLKPEIILITDGDDLVVKDDFGDTLAKAKQWGGTSKYILSFVEDVMEEVLNQLNLPVPFIAERTLEGVSLEEGIAIEEGAGDEYYVVKIIPSGDKYDITILELQYK